MRCRAKSSRRTQRTSPPSARIGKRMGWGSVLSWSGSLSANRSEIAEENPNDSVREVLRMTPPRFTRRTMLRGLGVALALPWLETLAPRTARAQAASAAKRYIMLYFPNGTADFWKPAGAGFGDAWKLSPI